MVTQAGLLILKRDIVYKLMSCLLLMSTAFCAWGQTPEYRAKAAYMEKFTHFIEWPVDSMVQDATVPFRLCVVGKDPFGGELQELTSLVRIKGKPVKVSLLDKLGTSPPCDMLFINTSSQQTLVSIMNILRDSCVLTISDVPGYAQQGVIINFINEDDHLRFEINSKAAQAKNIKISSRLLKLATVVK